MPYRNLIATIAVIFSCIFFAYSASAVTIYDSGGFVFNKSSSLGSLKNGLVGHWNFDGLNMGTTSAYDASGNNNTGWLIGGVKKVIGKVGQGLYFGEGTTNVNVGDPASGILDFGTNNFSVSVWFNAQSYAASGYTIQIANKQNTTGSFEGWDIGVLNTAGTNNLRFQIYNGSGVVALDTSVITLNKWYHAVGIRDSTLNNIRLYLNGVLVKTTNGGNTLNLSTTYPQLIGRRTDGHAFYGTIDDVRIYNRALSQSEVTSLYKQGATAYVNKSFSLGGLGTGLTGHWTFDGKYMGTTGVYDASGNNNTGTLTGGVTKLIGKIGQGLRFDGTTGYIDVHSGSFPFLKTTPFSGSVWIKTSSSAGMAIMTNWNITVAPGWTFDINEFVAGKVNFGLFDAWGSNYFAGNGTAVVNDGKWHHVAFTYDGSNLVAGIKLYVDGESDAVGTNGAGSQDPGVLVDGSFEIGRRNYSASYFYYDGQIDDARIYSKVLSPSEVKSLYKAGR